jgi:WD40 repeat protein/predicted Ser/Thr protein kinase
MFGDPATSNGPHDRRLAEAIDGYIESLHHGEAVSADEWVQRFPDVAGELRECLSALGLMRRFAPPSALQADLPSPDSPEPRTDLPIATEPPPPVRVRGYVVLNELGRGGMGVVYKALQVATKRIVALKFPAVSLLESPSARRRFEREVELAAALDHPGIVRVLESGDTEGHPYCAMEFVDGQPLNRFLAFRNPSTEEKVRMFLLVVEAVQYAHQHAVIHRDLKPSNILVDGNGRPRILDFGLARFVGSDEDLPPDRSLRTQNGQWVGTLPYLSPEQASGKGPVLDVRSDLYCLGVVFYEMLTGRLPYDASGPMADVLYHVVHTTPPRPSHLVSGVRADLDAVALKLLEKEPDHRYQTAAELVADLRAYLRGEPVEANRSGSFYLLRKAYARHRRHVQVAAALFAILLGASIVISVLYVQVQRERNQLSEQLHVSTLRRGIAHLAAGHDVLAEDLLSQAYRRRPDAQAYWSMLSYLVQNPLAARFRTPAWFTTVAFSPDGRYLAAGNLRGTVTVHDGTTLAPIRSWAAHLGDVHALAFSPDGRYLLTGGADRRIALWETGSWKRIADLPEEAGEVTLVRFARQTGSVIIAGSDGRLSLYGLDASGTLRLLRTFDGLVTPVAADVSPSGDYVAFVVAEGVRVHSTTEGRFLFEIYGFEKPIEALRISPNANYLAIWSGTQLSLWDRDARKLWGSETGLSEPRPTSLWDFPADARQQPASPHVCWTPSVEFSDDGALLACASWGAEVWAWEVPQGRMIGALRAHETAVYAIAFAPQSHRLVCGAIGSLRMWDLDSHPGLLSWPVPPGAERTCVAISGEAGLLAWGGAPDGSVRLQSVAQPHDPHDLQPGSSPVEAVAFDRAGARLATGDAEGMLTIWLTHERTEIARWDTGSQSVRTIAFSPDGESIASGGRDGRLVVWRCRDGSPLQAWPAHSGPILAVAFAPDGRRLLSGGTDWRALVWEVGRAEPVCTWKHREWVNAVAFSPDGRYIATGSADLTIRVGAIGNQPDRTMTGRHAHWINGVEFLDGGSVLVSGGFDAAIRFWDMTTGTELATLPSLEGPVHTLAVSRDGGLLAIGAAKGVQLIDLASARARIGR